MTSFRSASTAVIDLAEILRAVVNVRRHHGVQGRRIERGRTGCE